MAEFPLFRVQSSCKFPAAAIPNFRYFPLRPFQLTNYDNLPIYAAIFLIRK